MIRRTLLLALLALVAATAATVAFVTFTQPGTRWAVERITGNQDLGLAFVGVAGTFWSGLDADEIRYQADTLTVTASRAHLRILPRDLLLARLTIAELEAEQIETTIKTGEGERSQSSTAINSPIDIEVQSLRVGALSISAPGVDESATAIRIRGLVSGNKLELAQLSFVTRGVSFNASAKLQLNDILPIDAEVQWDATGIDLSGQGTLAGNKNEITIEHWVFTPDVVQVRGKLIRPLDDLNYLATVTAERLRLAADDAPLEMNGVALQLDGDLETLRVKQFTLRTMGGSVTGNGTLDLASPNALSFEGVAKSIDLSTLTGLDNTRIDVGARLGGSIGGVQVLTADSLSGRVGEHELNGSARVSRDGDRIEIEEARISLGDNQIAFAGDVAPSIQGEFDIDAGDLSQLNAKFAGRLAATGAFAGTLAQPVLNATGDASALRFAEQSLAEAAFAVRIEQGGTIAGRLNLTGLNTNGRQVGNALVDVEGTLANHGLSLNITGGPVAVSLTSRGRYSGEILQHTVSAAHIDNRELGSWLLDGPAGVQFRLADQDINISPHCWRQDSASACIDQTIVAGNKFTTAGRAADFPLDQLNAVLPQNVRVRGSVDAEIQMMRTAAGFQATGSLQQENLVIAYTTEQNEVLETAIESTVIRAQATDATAVFSMSAAADYDSKLTAELTIDQPFSATKPISGQFSGQLPMVSNLAPLIELASGLKDATGKLTADGQIFGTVAAPRFSGGAYLEDGAAFFPLTGISLTEIRMAIEGTADGQATVTGHARSGEGEIDLSGSASLAERSARIQITGSNFETLRTPDQQAVASPDIKIGYNNERIDIDGTLRIPDASFVIQQLPETAATPSVDAIDHDAQQRNPQGRRIGVTGEIDIALGDNVNFAGFGVTTRVAGGLRLRQDAKTNLYAEGALQLTDGRFDAYGQKLEIERGTLIFSGPLDDPKVDVKASRTVNYDGRPIKAGVLLSGTASNITTRIFSEPVMSEANALSYLVLGRPIEQAGTGDASALSNAAITMGLRQALPVVKRLSESVGLDEVAVGGDTTEETSVLAGKRFGDDLSIRYSYGLFSRIGTFIARYSLGRGFNIEASSGEDQSLELIYTVDR